MNLRRDDRGRPVGLAWPEKPEFKPETVKRVYKPQVRRSEGQNLGRKRQDECQNGHNMDEWGRDIKAGGRYCAKCRAEYSKRWQAENPEKMQKARANYRAKQKEKRNEQGTVGEQAP